MPTVGIMITGTAFCPAFANFCNAEHMLKVAESPHPSVNKSIDIFASGANVCGEHYHLPYNIGF